MDATWSPRRRRWRLAAQGLTAGAPLQASARSDAPADQPQLEIIAEEDADAAAERGAREAARPYSRSVRITSRCCFLARRGVTSAPEPPPALADSPLTLNLLLPNTPRDIHRRRTPRRSSRTRPRSRRHPQSDGTSPPWHHPLLPGQQALPDFIENATAPVWADRAPGGNNILTTPLDVPNGGY